MNFYVQLLSASCADLLREPLFPLTSPFSLSVHYVHWNMSFKLLTCLLACFPECRIFILFHDLSSQIYAVRSLTGIQIQFVLHLSIARVREEGKTYGLLNHSLHKLWSILHLSRCSFFFFQKGFFILTRYSSLFRR